MLLQMAQRLQGSRMDLQESFDYRLSQREITSYFLAFKLEFISALHKIAGLRIYAIASNQKSVHCYKILLTQHFKSILIRMDYFDERFEYRGLPTLQKQEPVSEAQISFVKSTFVSKWAPKMQKSVTRDIKLHLICLGSHLYDDNVLLFKKNCRNYKISKVGVSIDYHGYVDGLQFEYINLDTGEKIEGFAMGNNPSQIHYQQLKKDEYVIGVEMRKGMIVDALYFITSKKRTLGRGGEGGDPFSYYLPIGYHAGAISSSGDSLIHGIQFDFKLIPTKKDKELESQKKPFLFFENQKLFGYAIKYLSCRQVLRLFLVSKKIAEYRKTCVEFWMKFINQCDRILLGYLHGLQQQYKIEQLSSYLELYSWSAVKLTCIHPQKFSFDFSESKFKEGESYLIVVAAQFQNSVLSFKDTTLALLEDEQLVYSSIFPRQQKTLSQNQQQNPGNTGNCVAFLTRKLSIHFKYSEEVRRILEKLYILIEARTTWNDAYVCSVVDYYAMSTVCYETDVILGHFANYKNGIRVNYSNRTILKSQE